VNERSEPGDRTTDTASSAVVAVDVGGTTIKAALVATSGPLHLERRPTARERGYEAVLDDIEAVVGSVTARAIASGVQVVATAVAVPGIVDEASGVAVHSVALGWRDLPLAARLAERLEPPIVVRHDVRAAARAEAALGAAAGRGDVLFVAIGTGIAATTIASGRVLDGATSRAGELGQVLVADGVTLEDVASARGIAERYHAAGGQRVDVAAIADAAAAGEPLATRVWCEAVAALAAALAAAVTMVDPELIVLGGGVARAGSALLDPLGTELADELPWRDVPELAVAAFADDAGVVGAALEAWRAAGVERCGLSPAAWFAAPEHATAGAE